MKRTILTALCACIVFLAGPSWSFQDVRKVSRIEFRGLKYLSKYEIVSRVEMRVVQGGFIINMGSLNNVLGSMPMVQSFRVAEDNGGVVVAVVEREPAFIFAVQRSKHVLPFEVDEYFRVLSVGRVHDDERPVIIIHDDDLVDGDLSRRVKNFAGYLRHVEDRQPVFFRELSEISIVEPEHVSFMLRNRATRFYVAPGESSMDSVKRLVSYFDAVQYYPKVARIFGDMAVTK
ncbi:MAG TPA: hypothetical protein PKX12_04480 [Spirochaetota bacterium]|nr:hypothetical protein [Spirochaetota bacterium]